jgi:hypothetical protein
MAGLTSNIHRALNASELPGRGLRWQLWLPLAVLPATTVFPVGAILTALDDLGRPLPTYLSWSLIVALFAGLWSLSNTARLLTRLQDRVSQLESELNGLRSAQPIGKP